MISRNQSAINDLISVERVEVIKGPQSTLFGKNAIAGVINITTALPENEFGGKLHKPNSLLFEPTILTSIKQNMLVFKNENFSPIVPILIFETDKEVVEMANYANNFGCKRK